MARQSKAVKGIDKKEDVMGGCLWLNPDFICVRPGCGPFSFFPGRKGRQLSVRRLASICCDKKEAPLVLNTS